MTLDIKASSTILPMWVVGPALWVLQLVRGRDISPTRNPRASFLNCWRWQEGRGWDNYHGTQVISWQTTTPVFMPSGGSAMTISPKPALLCCPSKVLQLVKVGPALQTLAARDKWSKLFTSLRHLCGPWWKPKPEISGWSLLVIWTKDIDQRTQLLFGHRPRHGPQWQHRLGFHHGLRWQGSLHIICYFSPSICLWFYLSSQCLNCSFSSFFICFSFFSICPTHVFTL